MTYREINNFVRKIGDVNLLLQVIILESVNKVNLDEEMGVELEDLL